MGEERRAEEGGCEVRGEERRGEGSRGEERIGEQRRAELSVLAPVGLCGENSQHSRSVVNLHHICQGLQDIKVEERISRNRTVQPGFKK